ncbi:MAG: type III pantothenate kinase [Sulfuricella sp.]|nr:type III pantothenate kinase [Sulfuricella sp.]
MILAVDAGNTRLKWGLHDGSRWLEKGWVATADAARLADAWRELAPPDRIVASNVAGPGVRALLEEVCRRWPAEIHWVVASEIQCGVRNGYDNPAQFGSDRWAALVAARAVAPGGCVVVNAGTALTVDALSADGRFLGGLIVPGLAAMRRALAESTAAVSTDGGRFEIFPGNTADAVYSGALAAMAGAVERMAAALLEAQGDDPLRLLSGGDARLILPLLSGKTMMMDNLVLEGLIRIALA